MNATYVHLLLNHFPIVGTLIGGLLLAWGLVVKNESYKKAAAVLLVLMSLTAVPVYLTGEPAEESVESLPGVSEAMLHLHEQAATVALWLMVVTGVAALTVLVLQSLQKKTATVYALTLVLVLGCFAAMAYTGYYGGKIRHSEIRTDAVNSPSPGNENRQEPASKEADDD